jgi:hypothetical protein
VIKNFKNQKELKFMDFNIMIFWVSTKY